MNQYIKTIIRFGLVAYILIALSVVYLSFKDSRESKVAPETTRLSQSDIVDGAEKSAMPESPDSSLPLSTEKLSEIVTEPTPPPTPIPQPPAPPTPSPPPLTPIERVASHKTRSDCWIVVNGNVYNVTGYFGKHPGGDSALVNYCGKDATKGFETKELIPPQMHSMTAEQILASFLIP